MPHLPSADTDPAAGFASGDDKKRGLNIASKPLFALFNPSHVQVQFFNFIPHFQPVAKGGFFVIEVAENGRRVVGAHK